ncbi:pyridine nucleotide-disulfide oxidoreductase [Amycolatopsis acidicola]|uniref:Pyridine nucleotide-disulfide oxidoreductase n=1 Tax=Amycolatopsis acidicola TaxID=2596893 RepID=A0A5N0UQ64_9PSEU|nr:FAD-dependent oxidoreductase [Amycolatopsis acidicola]KAA9149312.1 pyridine nucleotide-disulfide oxidoreductase [Amycolatopsis acidicola]
MPPVPRGFVAVGGGQATATAVRLLRRRGFDGPVTVLADEAHAPYQRPPLSKEFLRGEAALDEITLLDAAWCGEHDVDLRLGTRAESVEPGKVRLADGSFVAGDAILLATGASSRRLPGIEGDRVLYLRTLDDAVRLRDFLAPAERIAVIGGGLIGSEVASSARAAGVAVTVLEAEPLPMLAQLGPRMAYVYAELHREFGVDLRCGQDVLAVEHTAHGVVVRTADGDAVEADLAVVAVGAIANDQIATRSGLAVEPLRGGIVVDDRCRTAMPGVFAAGDVAARAAGDRFVRVEHVDNATQQGNAVAKAVLGKPAPPADETPWFWSDQYDLNLQFVCRPRPDAELVIRGSVAERDFTAFYTTGGVVHAVFAMGRGEDIPAAKQLITAGLAVRAEALADTGSDLFDLLDTISA